MKCASTIALTLLFGCAELAPEEKEPDAAPGLVSDVGRGAIMQPEGLPDVFMTPTSVDGGPPDARALPMDSGVQAPRDAELGEDAEFSEDAERLEDAEAVEECEEEICNGVDDDCDDVVDEAGCPCDVVAFDESTYMLCQQEREWPEAREACQSYGYDLAVVDTPQEDAFLYQAIAQRGFPDTWVGLNDRADEGRWVWLDGEALVHTHWDRGEPNNGGGGEDCGLIMTRDGRQSEWDDRPCGRDQTYICEH